MTQPNHYSDRNETASTSVFNLYWVIGALIVLIPVGAGLYYLLDHDELQPSTTAIEYTTPVEQAQTPTAAAAPAPEPELLPEKLVRATVADQPTTKPIPQLPDLDNSDQDIIQALSALSNHLSFKTWFNSTEIIRKTVILTDNISTGKLARKYLFIPSPSVKFSTYRVGSMEYMDPSSYARYDRYIDIIDSIDIDKTAALYQKYRPLLNQAFAELGYPDRSFHETLMSTLETFLKAPIIENDLQVTRPSVMYKYVDPNLETLPAIHKQLLRIGPNNTRKLQHKLAQIKTALEQ